MSAATEEITVQVSEKDKVSALLYLKSKSAYAKATMILGHGAGANQLSGFMRMFAGGLAERGFDVITFNFIYMEQGRRAPDAKAKLETCYRAVIETALAHKKLKANRLAIGGKSMGGRIASQVAALPSDPVTDAISSLVFLGYPLHPPGKADQLRDKHLKDIRIPMLFVQGSRDVFGTRDEIEEVRQRLQLEATLYAVEGGDHSLKVPKSSPVSQQQVYELAMDEIARWVNSTVP
jgi:predicted alpha/beta-hydrolase family hydrolase